MTFCIGQNINDIDGNSYKTISIGNQVWMAENLRVSHYKNGDEIPEVTDSYLWTKIEGKGVWCYYHNDPAILR